MTKLCKFACVNELCQHIDKLLLSNDCVILPGFGGFLTHYADAYYSESEQLYYPPKREIGFNQNLTMNDSLLVQEIAGRYDISYPEACKRLEAEIEELRQTLQTIGHYEFTGIGTLSMIEEGVYTFEPYHAGIQTPDYYALNPLDIVEIKAIPENRRQPTESQTTSNGVSDPMQIVDSNETEVENNVAKRSNISSNTILRYVAAAAIALLVFFLSPLTLDQIGKPMNSSIADNFAILKQLYQGTPEPSGVPAFDVPTSQMAENTIETETESINNTEAIVTPTEENAIQAETKPEKYFTVVLASKVTKRNATNYTAELNRRGIAEVFAFLRDSGSRVLYGKYETQDEAYSMQRQLMRQEEFKDCWVMEMTNRE